MRFGISFFCLFGLVNLLQAQNPLATQPHGINIISDSQYQQIKYNGYTMAQLNSIANDEELLYDIFGSPTSRNVSSFGNISYQFADLTLGYKTEYEEDYISGFTATSRSALTVKVLGEPIKWAILLIWGNRDLEVMSK